MVPFLKWWLIAQIFGLAALPLTHRVFRHLHDQGYAFSKAVGLLLVSYLLWAGASTGLLVNHAGGITLALLLVAGLSTLMLLYRGWSNARETLRQGWQTRRGQILAVELVFLLSFAVWAVLRAYAPDKIQPSGGEKYMEIAFLNGILNSPTFPPLDPWLSGYAISYYYFGYVMMAVFTRLSGVLSSIGFDLYDALTFALTVTTAYGVIYNLVGASGGTTGGAVRAGLLGGVFVTVLGNLEGLVHALYSARWLPAAVVNWLAIPGLAADPQSGSLYPGHYWWWWRASRILNDLDLEYQPVLYQPINEFPFFSFLLGDNHPHKLALPFVLLAAGMAWNTLLRSEHAAHPATGEPDDSRWNWTAWMRDERAQFGYTLFSALVLGGLAFLNTWDFPIYLALTLLAGAVGAMRGGKHLGWLLRLMVLRGIVLGGLSLLLYLLFFISFSSQAGGVLPYIFPPTRLPQYLLMFGPFVFLLAVFLIQAVRSAKGGAFPIKSILLNWAAAAGGVSLLYLLILLLSILVLERLPAGGSIAAAVEPYLGGRTPAQLLIDVVAARLKNPWIFLLLSGLLALAVTLLLCGRGHRSVEEEQLAPGTHFAALLALVGLGLTWSVEFFYLLDSFGMRMNTVFKFYYQGWVLTALAAAYGGWWTARHLRRTNRAVFLLAAGLLTAGGMVYPLLASYSRVEGFSNPPTLDAAATVRGDYPGRWAAQPDDWAAIEWLLQQHDQDIQHSLPILLEAPGESYQHTSRVSAFTGFPTLLGWKGHEWQWRGSSQIQDAREPVIRSIYTTASGEQALADLRRWNVRYVILGEVERQYINRVCMAPEYPCNPRRALEKFDRVLTQVFTQGSTSVYTVPDSENP